MLVSIIIDVLDCVCWCRYRQFFRQPVTTAYMTENGRAKHHYHYQQQKSLQLHIFSRVPKEAMVFDANHFLYLQQLLYIGYICDLSSVDVVFFCHELEQNEYIVVYGPVDNLTLPHSADKRLGVCHLKDM